MTQATNGLMPWSCPGRSASKPWITCAAGTRTTRRVNAPSSNQ